MLVRSLGQLSGGGCINACEGDKKNDGDDNSSSVLTVAGGGLDYILSDNVSVGVHAYINNSFDMDHKEFFFTALAGLNIRLY